MDVASSCNVRWALETTQKQLISLKSSGKVKKAADEKPQILEDKSNQVIQSGFIDDYNDELLPSYTAFSMFFDNISHLWAVDIWRTACICEKETDEKYNDITPVLLAFQILDLHRANIFLSKEFVVFVWDIVWLYATVSLVGKQNFVNDLKLIDNEEPWLKEGTLVLSIFAECYTCVLRQIYTSIPDHSHPFRHLDRFSVLCFTQIYITRRVWSNCKNICGLRSFENNFLKRNHLYPSKT